MVLSSLSSIFCEHGVLLEIALFRLGGEGNKISKNYKKNLLYKTLTYIFAKMDG